jgi:hypothetical protein
MNPSLLSSQHNASVIHPARRVPLTENSRSPACNKFAVCSPLEENRLVAWPLTVPERAHCLRGLIVEALEHLVHLGCSERQHEPFAANCQNR